MKILEFNKKFWLISSLVLILIACLLLFINDKAYENYLSMKEDYVEVFCVVTDNDEINRTITVAYSYHNLEYTVKLQTIEYKIGDSFYGVIKPSDPYQLRFDNGYSMFNFYSICSGLLVILALLITIIILKRIIIKKIALNGEVISLPITSIKSWKNLHCLVLEYNDKKYISEVFRTFQNISLVEENVYINLYKNGLVYYIDLKSYAKKY